MSAVSPFMGTTLVHSGDMSINGDLTMKTLTRWILFSALSLMVASPVSAAPVIIAGASGAGFQSWTNADVNNDGKPYWDGKSSDGTNMNIGNWLTRTGGFSSDTTSPLINPPYWGFPLGIQIMEKQI